MHTVRFEAERSRILDEAGIPGKKVYITNQEIFERAQRLGKEIYSVSGTPLSYYIDLSNYSDAEMDELIRLKSLDYSNKMNRSLFLLCAIIGISAIVFFAELLFIIVLLLR